MEPLSGLKDRGVQGVRRLRVGRILIVAQLALSLVLMAGAGLFARTMFNLVRTDPGFDTQNLLLVRLDPASAGRRDSLVEFFSKAQESLGGIPGVQSAALVNPVLLGGSSMGGNIELPGVPAQSNQHLSSMKLFVSETFFSTMGIPIQVGRALSAADTEAAPKVVVNETFVRQYLSNVNPLGQMIGRGDDAWQIVGVCHDTKYSDIKEKVPPLVYYSFRQNPPGAAYFALRTSRSPLALSPFVRRAVAAVDADVPISEITTQDALRDQQIQSERMLASLCGAIALLALLLSCIGLYGLMAANVTRRLGEFGIRMALGAHYRDIAGMILREGLVLVLMGSIAGAAMAYGVTRFIASFLFGVKAGDPTTFIATTLLLALVTLLACWWPARRAARLDPASVLRKD